MIIADKLIYNSGVWGHRIRFKKISHAKFNPLSSNLATNIEMQNIQRKLHSSKMPKSSACQNSELKLLMQYKIKENSSKSLDTW